nr:immunoglobulin heavy chain junction region [Macaca mulatta]MOV47512.1 immunoglobulin heavy chain junction region [Macaca mulatta]MOV47610.1 immunoglobulin heavy chain junction region [Macaca mulatta]MOV47624.1 immunoglobulin heavy chain junction region [Macaca mulatta]MOV47637.1 immunoglobulin heavy chain junction region [Macaca mulatta]
CARVQSNFDYW